MERPIEYRTKQFTTCNKCSWTGPVASFGRQQALIPSKDILICPMCDGLTPCNVNTFSRTVFRPHGNLTIISGGQTGVDRGALDAAIDLGIPHRGWCTRGRKAEDGIIPMRYNMQEMSGWQYWKRTEKNIIDSDGTLVLPGKKESKGTALTIKLARKHKKPVAVIRLDDPEAGETFTAWIAANEINVLNIAGPRESNFPGVQDRTRKFIYSILKSSTVDAEPEPTLSCRGKGDYLEQIAKPPEYFF